MKKNIRKIKVNDKVYFYNVRAEYYGENMAIVTLKINLEGHRGTPYLINFKCFEHDYDGASLYVGVSLLNVQTHLIEYVTLHRPYFVRLCILNAVSNGWDASKKLINNQGVEFLTQLHLDTSIISLSKHSKIA